MDRYMEGACAKLDHQVESGRDNGMKALKKYKVSDEERIEAIRNISSFLKEEGTISFAYIYGSFWGEDGFNDIDVAVYLDKVFIKDRSTLDYQLELGVRLESSGRYPIDCRALNIAPLSFRFSVITGGDLIFSKDEKERVSFEVAARSLYFDFKPHADFYYRKMVLGR